MGQRLTAQYADGKRKLMDPSEYQRQCRRTMNLGLSAEHRVKNLSFGVAGEVGELVDLRKKELFPGKKIPRSRYEEEIGDVAWYIANLATEFEHTYGYKKRFHGNVDSLLRGLYRHASAFEFMVLEDVSDCLFALALELKCKPFEQILDDNIEKLKARYPERFPALDPTQVDPGGAR